MNNLNLPAKIIMQKKAQEAIGQFCDDLMTHAVLPSKMKCPLGVYQVDGDEYEFFVMAKVKVSDDGK